MHQIEYIFKISHMCKKELRARYYTYKYEFFFNGLYFVYYINFFFEIDNECF